MSPAPVAVLVNINTAAEVTEEVWLTATFVTVTVASINRSSEHQWGSLGFRSSRFTSPLQQLYSHHDVESTLPSPPPASQLVTTPH